MKKPNFKSNFLYGMGSVLDLFPASSRNPISTKSVSELISEDWEQVGKDIENAMQEIDEELSKLK